MREVKDFEKQIKTDMDQVEKNYIGFIKVLNGKRPAVYMEAKYLETYEHLVKSSNTLNKLHRQMLEIKYKINEMKVAHEKDDDEQKKETDSLIIKLFGLSQLHTASKNRWVAKLTEMTKKNIAPHWGLMQLEYWGKFQASCKCALDRVV